MHGVVVSLRWASFVLFGVALAACGGGGGLSDVGDQADLAPIAVATVIGGGANNTVRSGGVVILSSKDSDGQDSPILRTRWVANDPGVRLEERSANSVAFEAPNVAQPTAFSFTVTVFDAEDQPSSDTITLTVVPAQDLNKFLTIDGTGVGSLTLANVTDFQKFTVRINPVAAMDPVAPGDTVTVTVDATLNYADRNAACAASAPGNPTQCLRWTNNAVLQLGGAGYPKSIPNVPWNSNGGFAAATVVEVDIPSIDASLFNQLIIDAFPPGSDETARDALLDPWRADTAEITLTITLSSPIAAVAMVGGPGSSTIPLGPANDVTVTQILADADPALAIESPATSAAYYAAIDPGDDYLTLSDWLIARGFATRAADGSARLIQAASDGSGEFAHAVYTNNFDLGFGRDMFTQVEESTGNVYAFVTNYPTLQSAIEGRDEFVTVVMEYSPSGGLANSANPNDKKFIKFLVYAIDENTGEQIRVQSIDFDGRGLKQVPGVCVACHGGTVPAMADALDAGGYLNQGDIGAVFFPWDLESFLYSDTDAAIPASSTFDDVRTLDDIDPQRLFTRSAQEDQFRKLNMAALATYNQSQIDEMALVPPPSPSRYDTVVELVSIWYPNPVPQPQPADCNSFACLVGTFTDGAVPSGWATESQLYTDVYARHCRACHSQIANTAIRFATSADFLANTNNGDLVFRTGVMPLARLTMDRLWAGTDTAGPPVDILRNALPDVGNEIPGGPVPRSQFAATNPGSVPSKTSANADYLLTRTGRTVDVTGEGSLFFDTLTWSLADSSNDPDFLGCLPDPMALQADGALASLTPLIAADYCIALTASKTGYADVTAVPLLVRAVGDRPTNVLASDCSNEPNPVDGSTCVAVDEVTTGNPNPEVTLSAALSATLNPMRILAVFDQDLADGLDSTADFEVEFTAPTAPSTFVVDQGAGSVPTAATRFELDALLAGTVGYRSGYNDGPDLDSLDFTVYYTASGMDDAVFTGTAQVLILPKSDSAPMLQILVDTPPASVPFGGSLTGSFRVDDPDVTDVVVPPLLLTTAPTLATSLVVNTQPTAIGSASGAYTYTAADAVDVNPGTIACNTGGGFAGGPPADTFGYRVTTGTPGDATTNGNGTDQQSVTLTTTVTSAQIDTALADYIVVHDPVDNCTGCHPVPADPAFPWLFSAAGARATLNTGNPGQSTILNSGNVVNVFHDGIRPSFNIGGEKPEVLTWLYECAP